MSYHDETREMSRDRAEYIAAKFIDEVDRLLNTGAVGDDESRGLIFSVALQNISDLFRFPGDTRKFNNLRKF